MTMRVSDPWTKSATLLLLLANTVARPTWAIPLAQGEDGEFLSGSSSLS